MPVDKVVYYNRIDIGIFLYILETCLENKGIKYQRVLFDDTSDSEVEKNTICEIQNAIKNRFNRTGFLFIQV